MAKRKAQCCKLTAEAAKRLNKYLAEIRRGIENVSEMHTHDSTTSMTQADFEITYIDRLLGQTVTAISATMRTIIDALAKQKEAELNTILQSDSTPRMAQEDKQ